MEQNKDIFESIAILKENVIEIRKREDNNYEITSKFYNDKIYPYKKLKVFCESYNEQPDKYIFYKIKDIWL